MLTPLFAVFGIMLLGSLVQKLKLLPANTDIVLNQYVYYIAFPAIMFIALAQTPVADILHWGFIAGFALALAITYGLCFAISLGFNRGQQALASIRALNATFGNTAFIGIPLLAILYPQQQSALAIAAIASLLSVLMFAIALVSVELATHQAQQQHSSIIITMAIVKNPIVIGSLMGVLFSVMEIPLFDGLAMMIRQLGNTSSPCALFAIGMALAKALRLDGATDVFKPTASIEIISINLFKLIIQPLIAYGLLLWFGVNHQLLTMGVILAALPTAASVYLLAHKYQINAVHSAQGILFGTLVTFISLPMIKFLLS